MTTALSESQFKTIDAISNEDPKAKVVGFHYPSSGPLIIRGDGEWQSVEECGKLRKLAVTVDLKDDSKRRSRAKAKPKA